MHKKTEWGEIIIMSKKGGFQVSGAFSEDKVAFQGQVLKEKDGYTPALTLIPSQDEPSATFFMQLIMEEFKIYLKSP